MIGQEEKQSTVGLFPFFSKTPVIFDIGSNKGHWADVILDEYGDSCELHLFEPNEKLISFTEIKYEYKKNIIYNRLAAYKYAAEIPFYYFENENNELSSIYKDDSWVTLPMLTKKVQAVSIDSYCRHHDIDYVDCIKIDVEGADPDVIKGCYELLSSGSVGFILTEYGSHYVRANNKFKEIYDLVTGKGYKVYTYHDDNYFEVKDFTEDYRYENFIITKEEIYNYSADGNWAKPFIESVQGLPKFDLMLEVGAYEGITTRYMCENMLNEGGRVIVVDPLMDVYIKGDTAHPYFKGQYPRFLRNTRGFPVDLKRGDSEIELPKLHALRFDFCFIDGNHWPPHPYNDACWCFAECKIGGFILFDDYLWNDETQGSIDKFLDEFGESLEIIKKEYQVLIKKTQDQYNELTHEYYK